MHKIEKDWERSNLYHKSYSNQKQVLSHSHTYIWKTLQPWEIFCPILFYFPWPHHSLFPFLHHAQFSRATSRIEEEREWSNLFPRLTNSFSHPCILFYPEPHHSWSLQCWLLCSTFNEPYTSSRLFLSIREIQVQNHFIVYFWAKCQRRGEALTKQNTD